MHNSSGRVECFKEDDVHPDSDTTIVVVETVPDDCPRRSGGFVVSERSHQLEQAIAPFAMVVGFAVVRGGLRSCLIRRRQCRGSRPRRVFSACSARHLPGKRRPPRPILRVTEEDSARHTSAATSPAPRAVRSPPSSSCWR